MQFKKRIPAELFRKGHYLGRPADFNDKIVQRKVNLVKQVKGFTDKSCSLLDIGCGNGASMFLLGKEMKNCLGLDIEAYHKCRIWQICKRKCYQ